jgi:hypothetical protein
MGPAIGLLLASIIAFPANTLLLGIAGLKILANTNNTYSLAYMFFWVGVLMSLAASGFLLLGAVRMLQHRSYALVITAVLVAMLPWSPAWLLGLPMGIWALVVLRNPTVLELFGQKRSKFEADEALSPDQNEAATGRVRALLRSMRGYFLTTTPYVVPSSSPSKNGQESAEDA